MSVIAIPQSILETARAHFSDDYRERFGFFFAGVVSANDGPRFCVREFWPVSDEELDFSLDSERVVKLDAILGVVNRAKKARLAVIEAHNHPSVVRDVRFSPTDDAGLEEFSHYMLETLDGRPYGALVFARESIDARYFQKPGCSHHVDRIVVGGPSFERLIPTSRRNNLTPSDLGPKRYHRQVNVLGQQGQERLSAVTVAVVGLGGLGAHVAQQLAYLGVRSFILIDEDVVEDSNLNRLVGALPADVGQPKVEIATRHIQAIAGDRAPCVIALAHDVRHPEAIAALAGADVLFGCLDKDGPRLVLNEFSRAFVLPYFDLASGIEAPGGTFTQAGGRIAIVEPDGPCLACMRELDRREARYSLAPPDQQRRDREEGYVDGWDVPQPSVVSLNGAIASMAVNEFLLYVSRLGTPGPLTYYYFREPGAQRQRLAPRRVNVSPDCYTCSLKGLGALAGPERWWRDLQAGGARRGEPA